jgi:uncharacterized repeat protein (TIGR01451 family)
MRTKLALAAGVAAALLQTVSASAQVSVTATAGDPGPTAYATVKLAFDAINAGTHQDAITIDIQASTAEGATPAVLNSTGAGAALYTSILIRPTTDGVSIVGTSPGGRGVIELNGADSVTIDGDNPGTAGINRDLTIQNTAVSTTTYTSVVRVALSTLINSGNNNSVINTVILGSAIGRNIATATSTTGSENTTYGILVGGGASTTAATNPPSAITSVTTTIGGTITATNFVASNNQIDSCARGIAVQGSVPTVAPGLTVTNNLIGSAAAGSTTTVYSRAMTLQGFDTATISGNTIQNIESFLPTAIMGVSLGDVSANGTNSTVETNTVTNVFNQNVNTYGAYGINVNAGNGNTVRNNFVSNINHVMTGGAAFSTTFGVFGIRLGTGINHRVYHNSVNIFGTQPGTPDTSLLSAAFAIVSTSQTGIDVRNNAFANTLTGGTTGIAHVSIYLPSGATSAMNLTLDNNGYYSGTDAARQGLAQAGTTAGTNFFLASNFNASLTTPANNFRAYSSTLSAAGSNDSASFATTSAAPYTTTTDLHVPNGTVTLLESRGVDTAVTGVTTDIDGEARPNGIAPDSGADEFTGTGAPANDIASTLIVVPATGAILPNPSTLTPQAQYHNVGAAPQSGVSVQFTITGPGGYNYSDTQTIATIAAGQIVTVTFAAAPTFTTDGTYNTASTITTADANPANDQLVGTFDIQSPVAGGTHSVPGDYPSLTNPGGIFSVLNAVGATGNIVIEITADLGGETGAVALNELAGGFSVTIKPAGAPRTITGSSTAGIIRFNGADFVIIDGSLTGGTATGVGGDPSLRNLTVQNTNTTATAGAVVAFHSGPNGAQNNVIKNVNVFGQDPTQTLIALHIGGAAAGTAGTDNDNNRVENCAFQRSFVAVYHVGASAANPNTGSVITMNDLSATGANRIRRVGLFVFNDNGLQINLNSIGGIDTSESLDAVGMVLGVQAISTTAATAGGITNAQITRNRINGVVSSSTIGFSAVGIAIAGSPGGANTIANNTIAGVIAPSTSPDIVAGVFVAGVTGASTQLFYNSIENTGDRGAVANQIGSFGIAITGTNPTVLLRDNIFFNNQTSGGGVNAKSFSIGMVSTTFTNLDSNFNDFFVSGANGVLARTGNLGVGGADIPTLAAWQTAVSDDANSLNVDPLYVSTTDPHLQPASPLLGAGTPAGGITTDIDGDPRSATTPEIGADEILKADLSTTKVDGPDPVTAGTNLTYTITVSNAGPQSAALVSWSDTLPAGTTFVSLSNPGGGWSCTTPAVGGTGTVSCSNPSVGLGDSIFDLTVLVDPSVPAGTVISNTATVTAAGSADPNLGNESATATTDVLAFADLSATKADSPDPVTVGNTLTYTITLTNAGPSSAASASLADTLPAGTTFLSLATPAGWSCTTPPVGSAGSVSCTIPSVAPGNAVFTLKVKVDLTVPPGTVLTNNAIAASSTGDPNPGNETGTATTTVGGSANVGVTMTVDNPTPGAGTNVTFTITVTNAGPSAATAVQVTDKLPTRLTFVSATPSQGSYDPASGIWTVGGIASGGSHTMSLVATVTTTDTVVNEAGKTAQGEPDPDGSNNVAVVDLNGLTEADVQLVKTVDNSEPVVGANVTFTVKVTNGGPEDATGVEVTDLLPATLTFVSATPSQGTYTPGSGLWTVGSITVGQTATLDIVATVNAPGAITNTATKTAQTNPDYITGNDTASATLNDDTMTDLALSMTASHEPAAPGTQFTYSIVVTNLGPATATGVTVTDDLPAGVTFVSATPSQGNCTGTTTVTCDLGTIAQGGGAQIALLVTKNVGGSVDNTATVDGNENDPNLANNSNSTTTTPVEIMTFEVE